MPHEVWKTLSPHAQHICRFVKADEGAWPPGAGVMHPLAADRLEAFLKMGGGTEQSADEMAMKKTLIAGQGGRSSAGRDARKSKL